MRRSLSDKYKMMGHVHRLKGLLKVIYVLCGLALLYITVDFRLFQQTAADLRDKTGSAVRSMVSSRRGADPETKGIAVLVFGMKAHWNIFCKFPGMERFRHLVEFPRVVSCPTVSEKVTVEYSIEPKDISGKDLVLFTNTFQGFSENVWIWAHGNRSTDQAWVMISLDSPLYAPGLDPSDGFIHTTYSWMASYRRDAELYLPYGYYTPFEDMLPEQDLSSLFAEKTGFVAWVGSNCQTLQWDRLRLIHDMEKVVSVDIFGGCGDREIPWNDEKALREVLTKYKFYLSFESTCCEDFITEKFWRALDYGTIPIVVGNYYDKYVEVAPPNSFIHVDQFESLTALILHLMTLSKNSEAYLEYFKWRRMGEVTVVSQEEQYVRPIMDETYCSLVEYYQRGAKSSPDDFGYSGSKWKESCGSCGAKWIQSYMINQ